MSENAREVWFLGCGQCGRELFFCNNLTVISKPPEGSEASFEEQPCDYCRKIIKSLKFNNLDLVVESVTRLMDFCSCGRPERLTALSYVYLHILKSVDLKVSPKKILGEDLSMTLGYMLDYIGWLDHGSNIMFPFLTEEGEVALDKLSKIPEFEALLREKVSQEITL